MKKKEKLVILVLLIITIALVVVGIVTKSNKNNETKISDGNNSYVNDEEEIEDDYVVQLDDGTKVNQSAKIAKVKTVDGLKFSDIQLTEKDNRTDLIVNVTNTTGEAKTNVVYNVTLLDSKGKELVVLPVYIASIEAGETKQGATGSQGNYVDAYDYKV